MSTLENVAARIHADFAELLSIVGNAPSPDLVVGNLDHIKTIEQACNIKAAFDSLVAYSADQAINRQLITADTATDFLMDELNLSFQEANNRLRRGYVIMRPCRRTPWNQKPPKCNGSKHDKKPLTPTSAPANSTPLTRPSTILEMAPPLRDTTFICRL